MIIGLSAVQTKNRESQYVTLESCRALAVARRTKDGNDFQCDDKRSEMFQWKEGDTVSWMIQRACCKLHFPQYMCMYKYVGMRTANKRSERDVCPF